MADLIELREYAPSHVELFPEDRDWLLGPGRGYFRATPTADPSIWSLSSESTVGVVELPSGVRLHCKPKAPVRNVFYMLATAYGIRSPFLDQPLAFERVDELFDFLVEHLANLIESRLANGLYRAYLEREENLQAVRGRIMVADDVRHNAILRHRTFCQYTEFTWDIPENRVIRQTVFAVARLVQNRTLQQRMSELDRALGEIDPTPLPLSRFDTFHYHRLNEDYRPIHRLCRLLLEGSSVSEEMGGIGFRAFLLDMNRLFEQFLQVALAEGLPSGLELMPQRETYLDEAKRITIRPDLTLLRDRSPVLIADAKYKLLAGEHTGHADLYQVLAYCTAVGINRGVLIYPKWEGGGESTVQIRNSDISISRLAIDLGGSIADVRGEIGRLIEGLVSIDRGEAQVGTVL